MASLAFVVSMIFFSLIIIGPLTYLISLFSWMPVLIKYFFGIICALIGLWAISVPAIVFQILGLVNLSIGIKVLLAKKKIAQA